MTALEVHVINRMSKDLREIKPTLFKDTIAEIASKNGLPNENLYQFKDKLWDILNDMAIQIAEQASICDTLVKQAKPTDKP